MNMVQTAIHQVIHVVTMWNELMAAVAVVFTSTIHRCANIRVRVGNRNLAFIPVAFMFVMKMAIVYIIDMILMLYFRVAARQIMLMGMVLMDIVFGAHKKTSLIFCC
ncbi:hypothetical protein [Planococcus sp. ISL-110]|uniref:hypothetical protein n=1 Tax=Planococcus sp. ISL-110 TaxID=2819167 RepID=UPI001BEB2E46|nr:hypothetical protein [Planococcus sp. ISL-110]MBT2571507.1 hypothetical protein [Planococcus sp. ISL-110]